MEEPQNTPTAGIATTARQAIPPNYLAPTSAHVASNSAAPIETSRAIHQNHDFEYRPGHTGYIGVCHSVIPDHPPKPRAVRQ
jgi:hypothetical protein